MQETVHVTVQMASVGLRVEVRSVCVLMCGLYSNSG